MDVRKYPYSIQIRFINQETIYPYFLAVKLKENAKVIHQLLAGSDYELVLGNPNKPTKEPFYLRLKNSNRMHRISLSGPNEDYSFSVILDQSDVEEQIKDSITIMHRLSTLLGLQEATLDTNYLDNAEYANIALNRYNRLTNRTNPTESLPQKANFFPKRISLNRCLTSPEMLSILSNILPDKYIPPIRPVGEYTLTNINERIALDASRNTKVKLEYPLSIAILINDNHWVRVKINRKKNNKDLFYFDPLYRNKAIPNSILKSFPDMDVIIDGHSHALDQQDDGWSCGYRILRKILQDYKIDHPITRAQTLDELRDAVHTVLANLQGDLNVSRKVTK